MKLPRDCDGADLVRALRKFDYLVARQDGSHIRMVTQAHGEHHVTIPNHWPIKVGTLHDILKSVAEHHDLTIDRLLAELEW